jgi:hypothetical protein
MFHPFAMSPYPGRGEQKDHKRPSTRSPPRRPPLAERSNTDTNQRKRNSDAPSIRIVADDGPDSYSKTPFPTELAHFLPPKATASKRSSYSSFQDETVSDENTPTNPQRNSATVDALLPIPVYPRHFPGQQESIDNSLSSDADTLANYASSLSPTLSSRYSQTNTTPSTPTLSQDDSSFVKPHLPLPVHHPARSSHSTIRLVVPSLSENVHLTDRKQSYASISSSAYSDDGHIEIAQHQQRGLLALQNKEKASWTNEASNEDGPPDSQIEPLESASEQTTPLALRPVHPPSTDSIAYTDASESSVVKIIRQRSESSPPPTSHASSSLVDVSVIEPDVVQYPVVRKQSASGTWATVSQPEPVYQAQPPMQDSSNRMSHLSQVSQWSSRLSTIPSESDQGSIPLETATVAAIRSPKLRRVRGVSHFEAATERALPTPNVIAVPQPLFSRARVLPPPPGRDSEEGEDTLGELPAARLAPKRSGYLAKIKAISRPGSSDSLHSQLSFSGELDWVKRFYSGGSYAAIDSPYSSPGPSMSRLDTSTSALTTSPLSERFPAEIYRPRNRPRKNGKDIAHPEQSRETVATEASWTERIRRPQWVSSPWGSGFFTPHLQRDRRAKQQVSALRPPSVEDPSKNPLGPIGRQIILFCVGFVFPVSWFIAAFLSIPAKPESLDEKGSLEQGIPRRGDPSYRRTHSGSTMSIEQLEKQYVKAHWWRSLNRIMCVAGLAIIGAMVSLSNTSYCLHLKLTAKPDCTNHTCVTHARTVLITTSSLQSSRVITTIKLPYLVPSTNLIYTIFGKLPESHITTTPNQHKSN